jgi:DNA-binding CsgD family transcriptional regulator
VQLSGRELEVLKWAAEGKSMQDTAQILSISEHSVRTYLQNCQRKLKGANKLHTVVQALRIGVIR